MKSYNPSVRGPSSPLSPQDRAKFRGDVPSLVSSPPPALKIPYGDPAVWVQPGKCFSGRGEHVLTHYDLP